MEAVRKKEDEEYTINFLHKFKVSITKPLIPLKVFLFFFYGGGSFMAAFLTLYFKQRGVTLAEMSIAYMVSPIVQIGGTLLAGITADKIGRSKPVLIANLILTVLVMISIILVPYPNYVNCDDVAVKNDSDSLLNANIVKVKCNEGHFDENTSDERCLNLITSCITKNNASNSSLESGRNETSEIENLFCSKNFTLCQGDLSNGTLCSIVCSNTYDNKCNENQKSNETAEIQTFCSLSKLKICQDELANGTLCGIVCTSKPNKKCYDENQRNLLSKISMVLFILWMTVFSNCYRISDVTAMHLVTEYNADYGKQRLHSLLGNIIVSPLAGYLIKITSSVDGEQNFSTAFYLFISFMLISTLVVYKLDVQVQPPGKKMAKKARKLLKNPDILAFAFVLLVLGTSWMFTTKFIFWYLEEMQAPSILIGLIPAVGALYSLPFLFTSEWWIKTIGTTNFLIIGLLGYVICGIGYSFLKNPWLSLLLESIGVVTYHLLWVAVVEMSHEIAPEGLSATVISSAGSIHYHLGKTTGSLISGVVMNHFGGPAAYRFLAAMCFVTAVLYAVYLYSRHCYKNKVKGLEKK